jgi:hypothetical protein
MLPNECYNDMFSRLNLIVKELNSLNISNLDNRMINHKILMLLPKPKYNIINSMLQKEDLDEMEVVELVEEIRAHEMSVLGISEEATPSKSIALKDKIKKNSMLKMIKHESSSSEQDDDSSNDEDDDQELALLMRKFSRLSDKITRRVIPLIQIRKCSAQEEMTRTRYATIMVKRDTSLQIAPSPSREDPPSRTSKYKNQVMMRRTTIRAKTRALRGRKAITRNPSTLQRRRAIPREAF